MIHIGKYLNSFHGNINRLMIVHIVAHWYKHDLSVYGSQ